MTFGHVHKKDPANNYCIKNDHVFGTIFLISPYFALMEHYIFLIFIKNLIVLSDRNVARKGTKEKYHVKI